MSLPTINEQQYKEWMNQDGVLAVQFGAAWCAPCKNLSPILEQLADEYGPAVRIAKVDVDQSPQLAADLGVMGVPTVVMFRSGEPFNKLVGLRPKEAYKAVLDREIHKMGAPETA